MTRNRAGVFVRDAGAIVSSETVRNEADRLDAGMQATNVDAQSAPAATRNAWGIFYQKWRAFADSPNMQSMWFAGGRMDLIEGFAKDLDNWRSKLAASGVPASSPEPTRPMSSEPLLSPGTLQGAADIMNGLVKVGLVVGAIFLIHELTKK